VKLTIGFLLLVFGLSAVVFGYITKVPGETVQHLLLGWLAFIARSFDRLTWNWNGVATAGVCIALLLVGGHPFLAWLINPVRSQKADVTSVESGSAAPSSPARWKWQRTVQLLAVFILLFMAGTAFIGLVHQTAWLATAPEPLTRHRLDQRYFAFRREPVDSTIGIGFYSFLELHQQCPPNGIATDLHQGCHSWQARVLPLSGVNAPYIDYGHDWDDAVNTAAFQRLVPQYLNPDIALLRDRRGYGVSHYAGNSRLFERRRAMTPESIKKRSTNTIICGEVASDFAAWGDPANVRDPADEINMARNGFGSTDERGANFLMLDGSVRFLSANTDREVLTALATPEDD
jgi:prepilin-type processing-associated H-X9-DG protein